MHDMVHSWWAPHFLPVKVLHRRVTMTATVQLHAAIMRSSA